MRSNMPTLFNTVRTCIYLSAFVCTIICLAMAAHFEAILASSDLTRFVPFAIFVCSASLLIIIALLGFSFFLRERNPISTRIELGCLGLAGVLWLVLGVYLVTSDSQTADVQCFASETSTAVLDDSLASFHTDQYQAMYRVLNAFALINAVLFLVSCIGLLFLAVRRHRKGDDHMWHGPVTSCAWFNDYGKKQQNRSPSQRSILPTQQAQTREVHVAPLTAPPVPSKQRHRSSRSRGHSQSRTGGPYTERYPSSRSHTRQASGSTSTNDIESGVMRNPNRIAAGPRVAKR
ncbi:hypothetical protein EDD85DRAFT_812654 [Armillaria nabsnona]|nr:hypothetical protein EDD85DRAFT_812654 [Armillaria nabsnona]